MIGTPLGNLLAFFGAVAIAVLLLWPGVGLVPRSLRHRLSARRARLEDALKHVYHQDAAGRAATVESIGGALGTKPATTVPLVQSMQQAGLIRWTDGRVTLSEDGERYALQVIRAHRLWERYLADETGLDPREWHAVADRREHRMTPERVDALSERLGHPRFDPHGDPIPTAEGEIPEPDARVTALPEAAPRVPLVVVHVEDEPDVVFAEILAQGIHLGQELVVLRKDDRRVVLAFDGREVSLAPLVAANVSVRPLRGAEEPSGAPSRTLADLAVGQDAEIVLISQGCRGIERRRLMDLGIVPGTAIALERRGMTGGLSAYRVRGTLVALREEQAAMIRVETRPDIERAASGSAAS